MERAEKVAFLGLGIMGYPMAGHVAGAGFDLTVWTRDPGKRRRFAEEHDVEAADTPAEAARGAGVAITMVPDAPEVEDVLLGQGAVAAELGEGAVCIDMSTIGPSASREIANRLAEQKISFVDAPVTGSRPKAEDGTLTIMCGGEQEPYERARPVLEAMGTPRLVGPQGHGAMLKLVNNALVAVNAAGLAEQLALARAAELDLDAAREVLGSGAAGSAMLELKAGPMLEEDFEPLFKLDHLVKDIRHCLREAEALGVSLPVLEAAEKLYSRAAEAGHGEHDFAAVSSVTWQASRNRG
jgi:3-hydroxyisobutyrate dehydrogenase